MGEVGPLVAPPADSGRRRDGESGPRDSLVLLFPISQIGGSANAGSTGHRDMCGKDRGNDRRKVEESCRNVERLSRSRGFMRCGDRQAWGKVLSRGSQFDHTSLIQIKSRGDVSDSSNNFNQSAADIHDKRSFGFDVLHSLWSLNGGLFCPRGEKMKVLMGLDDDTYF